MLLRGEWTGVQSFRSPVNMLEASKLKRLSLAAAFSRPVLVSFTSVTGVCQGCRYKPMVRCL